jgi:hypothetical protein
MSILNDYKVELVNRMGFGKNQMVQKYKFPISDGTEVQIQFQNIMEQFGNTYYDSISYLKLKLN